jgi:hypothetical protein
MMKEILGVAEEPQTRRRWFHDEYFDLFVWQTPGGDLVSFQLCYGQDSSEQALVWQKQSGFFHDGQAPAKRAAADPLLARFDIAAASLPADIRSSVVGLVKDYLAHPAEVPARRKRVRRADWQRLESQPR